MRNVADRKDVDRGEDDTDEEPTHKDLDGPVVNGIAEATFTVAFFGRGRFTFDAQYLGSSRFQGSTSNAVTVNVF